MGSLFTTNDGQIIKSVPHGYMELDFVNGTITDSAGTVTNMNSDLNYYGLNQCGSIAVFVSDSDAEINIGNNLAIADHQLTHIINAYEFSNVRILIPNNSTPDVNQVIFMASTDQYLGYIINNYAHTRASTTSTTTDAWVTLWQKHVGGYDQTILTTLNTHGSNSMDLKIQFSEDGSTWFDCQGYTATNGVAIAGGGTNFDSFASDILHHFFRAQIKATSSGNQATTSFYWNLVQYT
jgi:hypothetical protein